MREKARPSRTSRAGSGRAERPRLRRGRIEERALWVCQTEPQTLGLAGAAQVLRIERKIDQVRGGQVVKHTEETVFGVTSLWPEEAGAQRLLAVVRDHWKIENGQ